MQELRATVEKKLRTAAYSALWSSRPVWRHTVNATASWHHVRSRPQLGAEAARCLADLRRDGVASTSLTALTGDDRLLGQLQDYSQALTALESARQQDKQDRLERGQLLAGSDKAFVVQLLGSRRPVVEPNGLLASIALHPQLQGVADEYFGLRTRVSDLNLWRNLPSGAAPVSSQLWHRDLAEDRMIVKAFVYLEPVDQGSGPFCYAKGTQPGGAHRVAVTSEFDGLNHRVPDGPEADRLAEHEQVFLGPAGTVVLADTLGYHRGGWATTGTRLAVQVRYASRAATGKTRLGTPDTLSEQERRAWRHRLAYDASAVAAPLLSQTGVMGSRT